MRKIEAKNLKEFNVAKLKENFAKRPDIFINILLIALTLFATIYLYSYSFNRRSGLEREVQEMEGKLSVVEDYKRVETEYQAFVKAFPQAIQSDQLIARLSDFAVARNVQILAFSPAEKRSGDFFDQISVNINIASDNYENILAFLKDVESSSYSIFIQKWNGKVREKTTAKKRERRSGNPPSLEQRENAIIEAAVEISSIGLKI